MVHSVGFRSNRNDGEWAGRDPVLRSQFLIDSDEDVEFSVHEFKKFRIAFAVPSHAQSGFYLEALKMLN